MTHNFSDDELNYLNPEDDDDGAEPGTEAAAFDPFADEDGDDTQNSADDEVEEILFQVGAHDTAAEYDDLSYDRIAVYGEVHSTSDGAFDLFDSTGCS